MQIVPSTAIVLVLLALVLLRGPYRGLPVLFALLPMGMMAAFNLPALGGASILAADLVVLVLLALLLARPGGMAGTLALARPGSAGLMLLTFLAYALVATLFFPRVFEGATEVFSLSRLANADGIVSRPLRPGGGNLSQLARMILSIAGFAAAAALIRRRPDPGLVLRSMQLATLVHVAMGLIDILTNATHTAFLLEPVRTANYALTLGQKMAGLNRMLGGFPEPSSYGYFTLGLLGFWLSYWFSGRGGGRGPALYLAMTVFVLLRGTSSSAYVGAALLGMIFLGLQMSRARQGGVGPRAMGLAMAALALLPILVMGAYVLYATVPAVSAFIDRSLLDKLASQSGVERMSWNAQALRNFLDTNLLGAGLGSVRASNGPVALLATTGLPGLALFAVFLWRVFRLPTAGLAPGTARLVAALKLGCAGFLARSLVVMGTPNLDIGFFAMAGFAVGLVAAAQTAPRPAAQPAAGPAPAPAGRAALAHAAARGAGAPRPRAG